jgi:predicted DNA-binding transcriptional regulator AlpA
MASRSLTLAEFLEAEQVAKSTFFKWKALGLAPATYKLPNGQIRIRRAAYEAWLATLEEQQAA